jgi:hypothetical protein
MDAIVTINSLVKRYQSGEVPAVDGVSFEILFAYAVIFSALAVRRLRFE